MLVHGSRLMSHMSQMFGMFGEQQEATAEALIASIYGVKCRNVRLTYCVTRSPNGLVVVPPWLYQCFKQHQRPWALHTIITISTVQALVNIVFDRFKKS